MQTDKVKVGSDGEGVTAALEVVSKYAGYEGLDKKAELRIRLLAEETLGMVSAIAEDFDALFWLESGEDKQCRIHLVAQTRMDYAKRSELLNASKSGKNMAARGIMGKIRVLMENAVYGMDEMGMLSTEYVGTPFMYGTMGMCDIETATMNSYIMEWSLAKYRQSVDEAPEDDAAASEAWDELEKSIVANIADDVRVGVKGDTVELVIEKRF